MNIVVAMKQIPDLQQIRIRTRQPVFDDVPLTLGDIDKNALEAAVNLKESVEGNVVVISAGNEEVEDTIKEALAAGADEAFLVLDDELENAESSQIATILAAGLKEINDVGLILFGEGSGDNYSGQVGSRVAELLDLPQVGYASNIEIKDEIAIITRSLEDVEEIIEVNLPAVVTIMADINEPRIPSVTQILKAGRKPKEVLELDELEVELGSVTTETMSNLAPESDRKKVVVKTVDELVSALTAENLIGR
ncbi:MAG TPA: electron transfer flavoprotein subunit beta/FixA family protein [Syntrophomonadaceae bacterium]|nr:electron transfer flavoprotein subunit beta/FixA family protein [Syntrophomonadaceae bacterium]